MRVPTSIEEGGGGVTRIGGQTAVIDRALLVVTPKRRQSGPYEQWVKPTIDVVGAAVLLVALAPLIALGALLVLLTLGRPVILRQPRVGLKGGVFKVYKFRTMRPDRRTIESLVIEDRRLTHKHPNDPRLNVVGRFLRKWSVDELPQLVNVLRGEMSLVGPRPEMLSIVQRHYEPWQHERHEVKPGLTGLWQVTDRGSLEEMYKHTRTDLRYVERISLRMDLKILLLTVPAALGLRKGF